MKDEEKPETVTLFCDHNRPIRFASGNSRQHKFRENYFAGRSSVSSVSRDEEMEMNK
jgi:hypothetical protein